MISTTRNYLSIIDGYNYFGDTDSNSSNCAPYPPHPGAVEGTGVSLLYIHDVVRSLHLRRDCLGRRVDEQEDRTKAEGLAPDLCDVDEALVWLARSGVGVVRV